MSKTRAGFLYIALAVTGYACLSVFTAPLLAA